MCSIDNSIEEVVSDIRKTKEKQRSRNKNIKLETNEIPVPYKDDEIFDERFVILNPFDDITQGINDDPVSCRDADISDIRQQEVCSPILGWPAVHVYDTLPTDEDEYINIFQEYFCNGDSLKKNISSKLLKIEEVETISIGFSTEKPGYWPVIRISLNEETCLKIKNNSSFKSEITCKLAKVLAEDIHQKKYTDLEKMIQIVTNYPIEPLPLCTAGQEIITVYDEIVDDQGNEFREVKETGIVTCNVHHCLRVGGESYNKHYTITGFHPVIPGKNKRYRNELPPLPLKTDTVNNPAKYTCVRDKVAAIRHGDGYDHLLSTLIRATVFSDESGIANNLIHKTHSISATRGIENDDKSIAAEFLIGKAGLIKRTCTHESGESHGDDCHYSHVIVTNQSSHNSHPCNVDIAALTRNDIYACSLEESFDKIRDVDSTTQSQVTIKWEGPPQPGIKHKKGTVVFVKENQLHRLSDKLAIYKEEVGKNNELYPYCSWELEGNTITPIPGDSGSSVFLMNKDSSLITLNLLGTLITCKHASPIGFSLDLIKYELSIHHTQLVIDETTEKKSKLEEGKIEEAKKLESRITCLEDYNSCLEAKRASQSLEPLPTKKYSELPGDGNISSKMDICTKKH